MQFRILSHLQLPRAGRGQASQRADNLSTRRLQCRVCGIQCGEQCRLRILDVREKTGYPAQKRCDHRPGSMISLYDTQDSGLVRTYFDSYGSTKRPSLSGRNGSSKSVITIICA
jgi:hypothetical protein